MKRPGEPIDLDWIGGELTTIEHVARQGDYERAHSLEDNLYTCVLAHIAVQPLGGHSGLAAAALRAKDIEFDRYCA